MDDETKAQYGEVIDEHLKQKGAVCMTAQNGDHVLMFTTETLERLLARSIEGGGKVMVLIQAAQLS